MEQLADESTDFADKLKECTVDVYRPMPVILAKRLARRHNRATSFTHGMTTQDKVCAKLQSASIFLFVVTRFTVDCHLSQSSI